MPEPHQATEEPHQFKLSREEAQHRLRALDKDYAAIWSSFQLFNKRNSQAEKIVVRTNNELLELMHEIHRTPEDQIAKYLAGKRRENITLWERQFDTTRAPRPIEGLAAKAEAIVNAPGFDPTVKDDILKAIELEKKMARGKSGALRAAIFANDLEDEFVDAGIPRAELTRGYMEFPSERPRQQFRTSFPARVDMTVGDLFKNELKLGSKAQTKTRVLSALEKFRSSKIEELNRIYDAESIADRIYAYLGSLAGSPFHIMPEDRKHQEHGAESPYISFLYGYRGFEDLFPPHEQKEVRELSEKGEYSEIIRRLRKKGILISEQGMQATLGGIQHAHRMIQQEILHDWDKFRDEKRWRVAVGEKPHGGGMEHPGMALLDKLAAHSHELLELFATKVGSAPAAPSP